MDIRFHDKLYSNGLSERKLVSIKKRIQKKSLKLKLFLITLPVGKQGILEVYWYPELLQTFYQKMDVEVIVVGIAKDRREAFELIKEMVADMEYKDGQILPDQIFKECK